MYLSLCINDMNIILRVLAKESKQLSVHLLHSVLGSIHEGTETCFFCFTS
jgi:hypothetical protein